MKLAAFFALALFGSALVAFVAGKIAPESYWRFDRTDRRCAMVRVARSG